MCACTCIAACVKRDKISAVEKHPLETSSSVSIYGHFFIRGQALPMILSMSASILLTQPLFVRVLRAKVHGVLHRQQRQHLDRYGHWEHRASAVEIKFEN